jgi:hypothetical protein
MTTYLVSKNVINEFKKTIPFTKTISSQSRQFVVPRMALRPPALVVPLPLLRCGVVIRLRIHFCVVVVRLWPVCITAALLVPSSDI